MSDLMNAIIAAKLMGNGGGGGGGGLPPITPAGSTVIYDQTLTFQEMQPGIFVSQMSDVTITDTDYTVEFDGVEYTPAYTVIQGAFVLGNTAILGGPSDTGEPFAISNALGGIACFASQGGSHTVKISQTTPQSPPDGSVLTVQNGTWAAATVGAGGFFYITPTFSGSTITAIDRTFAEIISAIDSGAFPVLWNKYEGHRSGAVYMVSDVDVDYITFHTIQPNVNPAWITINDDGTISQGSD